MSQTPLKTFIIYSRNDKAHKDELLEHLKPLVDAKMLDLWHDDKLKPGEEWEPAIKKNLKASEIILVLVTRYSLNSDFIQTQELKMALEKMKADKTRIIPIIVSPCVWELVPLFHDLQVLPQDAKAVTTWREKEEAWTNVAKGIITTARHIWSEKTALEQAEKERLAEVEAEKERKRLGEIEVEKERKRLGEIEVEKERKRLAEIEAQKERKHLAEIEAEKERKHLAEVEAEKERKRLAEVEAEKEKKRLAKIEAEKERKRLAEIEAEKEKKRLAEIEAEKEKKRLAEIEAEKERKRLVEKEYLSIEQRQEIYSSSPVKTSSTIKIVGGSVAVLLVLILGITQPWKSNISVSDKKDKAEVDIRKTPQIAKGSYTETVNGVSFEMIAIPGRSYYMGETEVTQALWKAVMGSNPSHFKGDRLPVETVSWNDAQDFIKKLNKLTSKNYHLPTEAEWEYAAKGGQNYEYAGSSNIDEVAWYSDNSGEKTHPVAQKKANGYGIYDMSGNVWEWTNTKWGDDCKECYVLRGGSWGHNTRDVRVANRSRSLPSVRYGNVGFRLGFGD